MSDTTNNNTTLADRLEVRNDIELTQKAADEVVKVKAENNIPESHLLRIGVKGGGCSGFSYMLAFEEESQREGDIVIEDKGVRILTDERSLTYLRGTVLDYSDGLNGRGFVFNNPTATRTCGCGSSFGV
jgi:iron-sulfur cluster assembly protein